MGAVKAMKMSMERVMSHMLDTVATLHAMAAKDPSLKGKADEVSTAADRVQKLVQEMRSTICMIDKGTDDEEAASLGTRVKEHLEQGDAHLVGWRAMAKRIKALM